LKTTYIESIVDRFCRYGFKCENGADVRHMVKLHYKRTQTSEATNCETRFNFPRVQFKDATQAIAVMTESQVQLDHVRQKLFEEATGKFTALYGEMTCHARNKIVPVSKEDQVVAAVKGVDTPSVSAASGCTFKCVVTVTNADPSVVIFDLCGSHGAHCKSFRKDMCIHPELEHALFNNANTGVRRQLNASQVDAESRALRKKLTRAVGEYTDVLPSGPIAEAQVAASRADQPRVKGGKHIREPIVDDVHDNVLVLDFTKPSPARAEQLHYRPSCASAMASAGSITASSRSTSRSSTSSDTSSRSSTSSDTSSRSSTSSDTSARSPTSSDTSSRSSTSSDTPPRTPTSSNASSCSQPSPGSIKGRRATVDTDVLIADGAISSTETGDSDVPDSAAKTHVALAATTGLNVDAIMQDDVDLVGDDRSVGSDGSDENGSVMADLEGEDAAADQQCDDLEELLVNTTEVDMVDLQNKLCPPVDQPQSSTRGVVRNFEHLSDEELAAIIKKIGSQRKRDIPWTVWTRELGLPSVLTCCDWNLRIRLTKIVSAQRTAQRNGDTAAAEFMRYLVQLLKRGHALVNLKASSPTTSQTVIIDVPDAVIDWKAGPHVFGAVPAETFELMASQIQEVIDAGMQVIHLVALVQAPLQKEWSQLPGCCQVLVFDDTFNASRIDMSLGAIMGYDPVSGKHLPLALVPLMYEQGVPSSKTNALVWVQTTWRRLGNPPPKTWQFDCDMASINSTTLHTIRRALDEVPRFLLSEDGRMMMAASRNVVAVPKLNPLVHDVVALLDSGTNLTFGLVVDALQKIIQKSAEVLKQHRDAGRPVAIVTPLSMVSPSLAAVPELAALTDAVVGLNITNIVDTCCELATIVGAADRSIAEIKRAADYVAKLRMLNKHLWENAKPTADQNLHWQRTAEELRNLGKTLVDNVKVPPKAGLVEAICLPAYGALQLLHPTSLVTAWIDGLFGVIVRLCDFHLKKAMKQHVTGHFTGQPEARKRFTAALMAMIHARTEESFQRQWKALEGAWRLSKPQLMEYLLSIWIKDGESKFMGLWEHYRRRYPHFLLNTTNAAEAFFSVLKYVISMGHREASLKVTMLRLLGDICAASSLSITKSYLMTIEAQRQHASHPDGTQRRGGAEIVDRRQKVFDMLQAVMAEPNAWVRTPVANFLVNPWGLYEIKSATSSTWYFVNLLANTCTCPLGSQCCKHILTLRLYHAAKLGLAQLWRDFEHYSSYPIRLLPVSVRDLSSLDGFQEDRIITSSFAREPVPVADNDRLIHLALGTTVSGNVLDELQTIADAALDKHRSVGLAIKHVVKRRVEHGAAGAMHHLQAIDGALQNLLDRFPGLAIGRKPTTMMRLAPANRATAIHQSINNGAQLQYGKTKKRVRLAGAYRTPIDDDADDVPVVTTQVSAATASNVTVGTAANVMNDLAFGAVGDSMPHVLNPRNLLTAASAETR
jgi:hypothetical protein